MRYKLAIGAMLSVAVIAAATGCSLAGSTRTTTTPSPSASPSPSISPAAALTAAVDKTAGTTLKVVLGGSSPGDNLTGTYDGVHHIGSLAQVSGTDRLKITVTADDLYLGGLTDLAGNTMHLQISKLDPKNAMAVFTDAIGALTLLTAAQSVESTGPTSFSGTIDLTKAHAATAGSRKFIEYLMKTGGSRVNAIKFTASVNEQGYVTEFDAPLPNVDDGKDTDYQATFSDFGSPVSIARPTGPKVIDAPASMYKA